MKKSYVCPICSTKIELMVTPSSPPVCSSPKHKTNPKQMKESK